MVVGGLPTADPLDKGVGRWWKDKVDEIYGLIPDFGGFLVKANSEGQPGPCDYGRTHAEGANMLAAALARHGGIVMWRAFVYSASDSDRAKQASLEFQPLDGEFAPNVIVQIKNGPIDFQPREPYSPLFTSLEHTPTMVEMQLTQEYLGFSNHIAYLAPLWKEFFDFVSPSSLKGIAGVANTGDDVNWCGHHFGQSNWYAFGRMAWDPGLTSGEVAEEWLKQTFCSDSAFVTPVKGMMLDSREAVVDYMMPLGLHHIFAWGHHYGPEPWCEVPGARHDWLPSYYHRADKQGIGLTAVQPVAMLCRSIPIHCAGCMAMFPHALKSICYGSIMCRGGIRCAVGALFGTSSVTVMIMEYLKPADSSVCGIWLSRMSIRIVSGMSSPNSGYSRVMLCGGRMHVCNTSRHFQACRYLMG